jgi:hypothetical protein
MKPVWFQVVTADSVKIAVFGDIARRAVGLMGTNVLKEPTGCNVRVQV